MSIWDFFTRTEQRRFLFLIVPVLAAIAVWLAWSVEAVFQIALQMRALN
jgi:hypothetical protein